MELKEKTILDKFDMVQISGIWNDEYPKSLNFQDYTGFENYLAGLSEPQHVILQDKNGEIVAWGCKFIRDNEKWFALILDQKIHGLGKGTEILNALKEQEVELNGWVIDKENSVKINGDVYRSL